MMTWEMVGRFVANVDAMLATARLCAYFLLWFVFTYKALTQKRFRWFNAVMSLAYVGAICIASSLIFSPNMIDMFRLVQTPIAITAALTGVYYLFKENLPDG